MAVYPDRIVLKNSTDSDSAIRTAIGTGGTDPISQGELVLGIGASDLTIYSVDGSGNVLTVAGTAPTGLTAVVDDTTPQLGGNLDVNGNYIVSTTAGDIEIAPDTTGNFIIRGNDTDGSITLNCTANTHGVTIQSPPHSAAASYTLVLPDDVGTSGQTLTTDGSGNLSWTTSGGAVSSVNTQTGAVSLGVQDMDDFELNQNIGTVTFANKISGAPTASSTLAPDEWQALDAGSGDFWLYIPLNATNQLLTAGTQITLEMPALGYSFTTTIPSNSSSSTGTHPMKWTSPHPTELVDLDTAAVGTSLTITSSVLPAGIDIPLAEGDLLQWNNADSKFKPATLSIDELNDVDTSTTTPTNGQALVWDSTLGKWEPGTVSGGSVASIDDIGDVDTTTVAPTDGQALIWDNANSQWEPGTVASGSVTSIDDIGDVDTTTVAPTDGQALVWDNANSQWEPGTVGSAASAAGVHVTQAVTASSGVLTFDQIGSAGLVRKVASDIDAWVVLYSSAAARTADSSRSFSTDPSISSGVLFEAYITGGSEVLATPGTGYFNDDATPGDAIYAAVRSNTGTAVNATVTFYGYAHGGFVPSDYISKATMKSEVAASTDFADFQSRIAAL